MARHRAAGRNEVEIARAKFEKARAAARALASSGSGTVLSSTAIGGEISSDSCAAAASTTHLSSASMLSINSPTICGSNMRPA